MDVPETKKTAGRYPTYDHAAIELALLKWASGYNVSTPLGIQEAAAAIEITSVYVVRAIIKELRENRQWPWPDARGKNRHSRSANPAMDRYLSRTDAQRKAVVDVLLHGYQPKPKVNQAEIDYRKEVREKAKANRILRKAASGG